MARRHLGFTIDQWQNELPWWQQQVYAEGLEEEFFSAVYEDDQEAMSTVAGLGVNVQSVG
jgi:hypothetical protein